MFGVMTPDVSVCIATFRRPEGLERLLTSLAGLALPAGLLVELVVVDNDPAGSAEATVRRFAGRPHPVHYQVEPRPNVSHARNTSVTTARGTWVAFIDDDEVADERWLAAFWACAAGDERDGFFGPVLPRLEANVSPWLDAERFYGRPRHATGTRVGLGDVRTGNALVRRALFDGQLFDPQFGAPSGHAEDRELFGRMLDADARFAWCDEAVVTEFIPPGCHRLGWLGRRAVHNGYVTGQLTRPASALVRIGRALTRAGFAAALALALQLAAAARGRAGAAHLWLRLCVQAGHVRALLAGA